MRPGPIPAQTLAAASRRLSARSVQGCSKGVETRDRPLWTDSPPITDPVAMMNASGFARAAPRSIRPCRGGQMPDQRAPLIAAAMQKAAPAAATISPRHLRAPPR